MIPEMLGVSSRLLAVSSPMSQLLWIARGRQGMTGQLGTWGSPDEAPISFFNDIDVHGRELAILGLMRSDTGMSPDGAIAWIGELQDSAIALHPIAYSKAGKGARPFDRCSGFAVGKVRFLDDGRLILVPGAEPGIDLYSRDGRLQRTWDSVALGLDLRCDFDERTMLRYNSDVQARLDYINRFDTVDEVLPTSDGPALLIRSANEGGTNWRIVLLGEDGLTQVVTVPIHSQSRRARLRGDVFGDHLLLILREIPA